MNINQKIFKAYDIRGVVPEELNEQIAERVGKAFLSTSENFLLYLYGATVTFVILTSFFVTFTKYKDPYETALEKEKRTGKISDLFVSCMVAVKDEENIIEQCVLSLINQTYKYKEIIFVNDASTDGTKKILDKYAMGGGPVM